MLKVKIILFNLIKCRAIAIFFTHRIRTISAKDLFDIFMAQNVILRNISFAYHKII